MSTTSTPRQRAREQTMTDILRIGRAHLASEGAAALSLRAVARELGVVSSAIYRYVASRDELLTLLIVEAYAELGSQVEAAVASAPSRPFARFAALADAVRAWALAEPARYALLYGTPVPGYQAPAERTNDAGTRVVVVLIGILEEAWTGRAITGTTDADTEVTELPPRLAADLESIRADYGLTLPAGLLVRGMSCWAGLFGAVNFEVFGHYGASTLTDPAEMFHQSVLLLARQLGLEPDADGAAAPPPA